MDRNLPLPLYYQIKEELLDHIKNGDYVPDSKIPSENEFIKIYNVSSITIRKALSELVNEGYLYRIQGKGTYVSRPKFKKVLSTLSFTDELIRKGFTPKTKLLDVVKINSIDISEKLNISITEAVFKIKRLRFANDEPMAIQTSYIPSSIIGREDVVKLEEIGSLYSVLKNKNIIPFSAKEIYSIQIANSEVISLLNIKKNSPVLFAQRYTFAANGLNFEYAESILRGDTYQLEIDVKGET